MKISKMRSGLYRSAKYLGDYNALAKGTVAKRVARRVAGKYTGRGMRRLIK
jgi:hypothetical protein